MARKITLYDSSEEKVCQFWNATIDICKSHTTIHKQRNGNIVIFPLAIERIEFRDSKIMVTYSSSHFIIIIP